MKYARINNNIAVEIINFNPDGRFHSAIEWIQVPDEVGPGWEKDEQDIWTAPPEPIVQEPDPKSIILSVIEFKMCFTSVERIAIYALRDDGDDVIIDWLSIIDDPRCTVVNLGLYSTQEAVNYLIGKVDGFSAERCQSVLNGTII